MSTSYRILYQLQPNQSAKILRIYAASSHIIIPKTLGGFLVTEIASYCFSEKNRIQYENIQEEIVGEIAFLQEICGNFLEEISLPDNLEKIGSYAFYNCKKLQKIEFGANIREIGSDAFMNTIALHQFVFRCSPARKSGIKQILDRFSSDMEVTFLGENGIEACLFYPEYYEYYAEIAPAHLFGRNIEGEGFRARQCIQDGIVDFAEYDGIFLQACVEEPAKKMVKMALGRLQYAYGLKEEYRQMYRRYLLEERIEYLTLLIEQRSIELLQFVCEENLLETDTLSYAIQMAAQADWAEGTAELLQQKSKRTDKGNRYSFDAF